jgi:hypothetical protein
VTPVAEKYHMDEEEAAAEKRLADDTHQHLVADVAALGGAAAHSWKVALAWSLVWIPLGWGVWMTLQKTFLLFR